MDKDQPISRTGLEISITQKQTKNETVCDIIYRNPLIYILGISATNSVIFLRLAAHPGNAFYSLLPLIDNNFCNFIIEKSCKNN